MTAHGDAQEGKWRRNWQMEWVAGTHHTTSKHSVSSFTTADAHTSAASSRLNWRPHRFKWTRPFRRKTKSGFCACAITFQTQSKGEWSSFPRWVWVPSCRNCTWNRSASCTVGTRGASTRIMWPKHENYHTPASGCEAKNENSHMFNALKQHVWFKYLCFLASYQMVTQNYECMLCCVMCCFVK